MSIDRYRLVSRHNPILNKIDLSSPLSVGNGEFAFTVDVTGMQTLYDEYKENHVPLCTMSQWGWHITPVNSERYSYSMDDLAMTEYEYAGRTVTYAVEQKNDNEEVYQWLRQNPHRMNLANIGLIYKGCKITANDLSDIHQELKLYEGVIESNFSLHGIPCKVQTCCSFENETIAIIVDSELIRDGSLSVIINFPYGAMDITASDWNSPDKHETNINQIKKTQFFIERILDRNQYYVGLQTGENIKINIENKHKIIINGDLDNHLELSVAFAKEKLTDTLTVEKIVTSSVDGWKNFWENGGAVDLHKSKDSRALELERRIVLSQYVSAIQSCGSMPPQETGLTCNSWYGKFHLEMYIWHCGYLPLWNRTEMLDRSLGWYLKHLKDAKANAERNGFKGAKWPKQVAYDAIDSPSPIATLLIWQQPHIIYMLELAYQSTKNEEYLREYWEVLKETADYMVDFAVYNQKSGKYDLNAPIIPAQEEHDPRKTCNPTFEVEYWRFTLNIAATWAKRLGIGESFNWLNVADNMADMPVKDGLYLAHENCPTTFVDFNRDHPSMVGAFGLIYSDRVDVGMMKNTLEKVVDCWDFDTIWGWDFAMMAMTATRLHDPDTAINILLKETSKNCYVASGNNFQKLRTDLPLYLPGNGALLLAIPIMTAGFKGCDEILPGFPKNGMWEVEYENINPFPY